MLRKLRRISKGQSTAEYAILLALVVGAVISMQVYVQRAIKGRIRDAVAVYMLNNASGTGNLGNTAQYEPYYLETDFYVTRDSADTQFLKGGPGQQLGGIQANAVLNVKRTGNQLFNYNGIVGF